MHIPAPIGDRCIPDRPPLHRRALRKATENRANPVGDHGSGRLDLDRTEKGNFTVSGGPGGAASLRGTLRKPDSRDTHSR